jgi:ELWxxDGT repeat protein
VKDIRPGTETSNPRELTSVNGQLFFVADDGVSGAELWTTDGTEAGTVRVRDIHSTGGSEPRHLTSFQDKLYFSAEDGTRGRELWVSDGTESGTTLLKDIDPRTHGANLGLIGAGTNVAYFFVDAQFGELWKSDGTELGTTRVHASFAPMGFVTIVGDSAFFCVDYDLWFYDSSTNASRQLRRFADWGTNEPVVIGNQVFFVAEDSDFGDELWVSDGTEGGTRLVKDITPGAAGTYIRNMQKVGQRVFFHAYTPETGTELWTSDGTAEGTSLVKDIWPGAETPFRFDWPAKTAIVDDSMYFLASDGVSGAELWKSDGTSVGTFMVKDLSPGPASTYVHSLVGSSDGAYFILGGGTTGITTVWKTDGTEQGTFALNAPLPIGYAGIDMIPDRRGGVYLFAFTAGTLALWKVDEHGDFSYLRAVPYPASAYYNAPPTLFTIDDTLYFFEQSSLPGLGTLWQSDGTVAGTGLAFDCSHAMITPVIGEMFQVNGTLFFTADDGMHGIELWTAIPTPPVAGDLDGDGGVGRPDVALMLQTMLGQRPLDAVSDLDGDGNATIRDLILLRNQMSFPQGDVNEDGRATLDDLSELMKVFGASSVIGPQRGDINSDGQIDLQDVVALRSSICTSPVAASPRKPSPAAADAALAAIATTKKRRAYARSAAGAPPVASHSPSLSAVSTSQLPRTRLRAHFAVAPRR